MIMATTINSHSIRHSRRFRNKKFHLKDGVMGEYLKIEPGSMLLRLVDVSEEDSSSAEKSKMADITWFTGKGFFKYNYRTRAIISRGLYVFYPIFKDRFFVFKEVFSENSVLMYGLYSRAACNQERLMMAPYGISNKT